MIFPRCSEQNNGVIRNESHYRPTLFARLSPIQCLHLFFFFPLMSSIMFSKSRWKRRYNFEIIAWNPLVTEEQKKGKKIVPFSLWNSFSKLLGFDPKWFLSTAVLQRGVCSVHCHNLYHLGENFTKMAWKELPKPSPLVCHMCYQKSLQERVQKPQEDGVPIALRKGCLPFCYVVHKWVSEQKSLCNTYINSCSYCNTLS